MKTWEVICEPKLKSMEKKTAREQQCGAEVVGGCMALQAEGGPHALNTFQLLLFQLSVLSETAV